MRINRIKDYGVIKSIVLLAIVIFILGNVLYYRGVNNPVDKQGRDILFEVRAGEGVKQISENLEKSGIIKSSFYFNLYVRRNDLEKKFQAGSYILNPMLSAKEIAEALTEGRSLSKEKIIKIIEGWNIRDIDEYLAKQGIAGEGEFEKLAIKNIRNQELGIRNYDFLDDAPKTAGLEGYLFPDTYRIFKDASLNDIVLKMLANFDKKLSGQMREDIKREGKTIYEIVTMASLLEKEVRTEEDMKIVSGIFWDRIKNNQALESCATLAYILGVNKPQYTTEDTKIDSPYNTYQNRGLPPGPISNPGLKAIRAAIYPEYTNYNYFLSRPDTGETVFSASYEEHVRNKQKYLR